MQVQITYASVESSDALETHLRGELESAVGRFADRVTRIEAHLSDVNGPDKGGPDDQRCRLEARPSGMDPVVVESVGDSLYTACSDAASKLRRLLTSRLDR